VGKREMNIIDVARHQPQNLARRVDTTEYIRFNAPFQPSSSTNHRSEEMTGWGPRLKKRKSTFKVNRGSRFD
jgi:hypothetical protein